MLRRLHAPMFSGILFSVLCVFTLSYANTAHGLERVITCPSTASASGEATATEPQVITSIPTYTLEQPLLGESTVENFGEYLNLAYQFSIGIIGILATVLIMFGGVRWITAAGNEQAITSAKETIIAAVTGLAIGLLSFTILQLINPQITNLDLGVIEIPPRLLCEGPRPEIVAIPEDIEGVNANGRQGCPGMVAALERVAEKMRNDPTINPDGRCDNCTIEVRSGYRDPEVQNDLYVCYLRALENGVTDGSSCPEGCTSCNLACQPCGSSHEEGKAVDVCLEGYVPAGPELTLASSCSGPEGSYLRASYNNGGSGDGNIPGLAENQQLLRDIMTSTGDFKPISTEWWHFEFTGSCVDEGSTCSGSIPDNAYCVATDSSGSQKYKLASCVSSRATCEPSDGLAWKVLTQNCPGTSAEPGFLSFDDALPAAAVRDTKPECKIRAITSGAPGR